MHPKQEWHARRHGDRAKDALRPRQMADEGIGVTFVDYFAQTLARPPDGQRIECARFTKQQRLDSCAAQFSGDAAFEAQRKLGLHCRT